MLARADLKWPRLVVKFKSIRPHTMGSLMIQWYGILETEIMSEQEWNKPKPKIEPDSKTQQNFSIIYIYIKVQVIVYIHTGESAWYIT